MLGVKVKMSDYNRLFSNIFYLEIQGGFVRTLNGLAVHFVRQLFPLCNCVTLKKALVFGWWVPGPNYETNKCKKVYKYIDYLISLPLFSLLLQIPCKHLYKIKLYSPWVVACHIIHSLKRYSPHTYTTNRFDKCNTLNSSFIGNCTRSYFRCKWSSSTCP